MKKIVIMLLLIGTVLVSFFMAEAYGKTVTGVVEVKVDLNVRKSPDTKGEWLATVSPPKRMNYSAVSNGWYEVEYESGKWGWSYGDGGNYLKVIPVSLLKRMEIYNVQNLYIRDAATTNSNVIGTFPRGTIVEVYGVQGIWHQIKFNNQMAWTSGYYLRDYTGLPKITPVAKSMEVTNVSSLYVRDAASVNSKVIGYLPRGTHVAVTGLAGPWTRISFNGEIAWVAAQYLKEVTEPAPPATGNTWKVVNAGYLYVRDAAKMNSNVIGYLPRGAMVEVISSSGPFYTISFEGRNAYVAGSYLQKVSNYPVFTADYSFKKVVKASRLVVRDAPSMDSKVIGSLPKGEVVEVDGKYGLWRRISYKNHQAYVAGNYLEDISVTAITPLYKKMSVFNVQNLFVRNAPTLESKVIGTLSSGTTVLVTGKSGLWHRIQYGTKSAWVSGVYLKDFALKRLRVMTSDLTVRAKPGFDQTILAYVQTGQTFDYFDIKDNWYLIEYQPGKRGWVSGNWIRDITDGDNYSLHFVLSSHRIVPGTDLLISIETDSVDPMKYKLSIDGNVVINWTNTKSYRWKNPTAGSHTIVLEAQRDFDGQRKKTSETVTLTSTTTGNTYVERLHSYKLQEFATTQLGRSSDWSNGWTENVPIEDIQREMDPKNIYTLSKPLSTTGHLRQLKVNDSGVSLWQKPSYNSNTLLTLERGSVHTIEAMEGKWFKITVNGKTGYINSQYASDVSKVTGTKTTGDQVLLVLDANFRTSPSTSASVIEVLDEGGIYPVISRSGSFTQILAKGKTGWVSNATLVLTNNVPENMFQFLDLRGSTGIAVDQLNKVLENKGILSGKGSSFKKAGEIYNINELYLVSHSLLETGNGRSVLATGVEHNGTTVYNMYGIGAFDSDPINMGARYAYNAGWTTPEKAIIGGAEFIAESYVNNAYGQNTIYKMRWNAINVAHQYARDIGWARKQVYHIANLYNQIHGFVLKFEVPNYRP